MKKQFIHLSLSTLLASVSVQALAQDQQKAAIPLAATPASDAAQTDSAEGDGARQIFHRAGQWRRDLGDRGPRSGAGDPVGVGPIDGRL